MHIKLLSVAVGAALLTGCGTLSGDGSYTKTDAN